MKKVLMALAVMGCVAVACEKENKIEIPDLNEPKGEITPIKREDIILTKSQEQLAAATADFSFEMLKEAGEVFKNKDNIVLSPLSVSFAMSMLANGADGNTRKGIIDALGFKGADIKAVNEYSNLLLTKLPNLDNTGVMSIANSLWLNLGSVSKGFKIYDSFSDELEGSYNAVAYAYDFAKGPGKINEWCSNMTNGLISEALKELNPEAVMALANALYFKGIWNHKFDKKSTTKEYFSNGDGSSAQVDMMNSKRSVGYMENDEFALAELSYGNKAFSFQIMLPNEGVTVDECLGKLGGEEWLAVQNAMKFQAVELKLPKFKLEMNESVNKVLMELGMKSMFERSADFSNLSDIRTYVSDVQQATYFSVDEEGSEAAAVTIVQILLDVAGPGASKPEYIPFHVNRPFLFVLKEASTDSILFIGKVTKL